ncbi:MAG: ABC transporter permease [Betaproteobacteria bacterium]|nr:ABC transporter permease [Betaproteobacteria bacterium]
MNAFRTIFKKELVDSVRDRRTIAMIMVASILTGPLVLMMLNSFVAKLTDKAEAKKVQVSGMQHAPTAINFFQRQGAEVIAAPDDYLQKVKDGKLDAVVVFKAGFEDQLRAGKQVAVEMVFDDSRSEAGPSIGLARSLLNGFGREQGVLRLMARGVSPDVTNAVKVENINVSTPKQRAAMLLFFIPMTTLILCITGGMAVAIDSTAGERERGSLEPLLLNPVKLTELILGKWSAVSLYASVVVLLAILGYVLTLLYMPIKLELPISFGWQQFGLFSLIAVPLAAMLGAVLMLIATFGRSYKEAQTYASYVITVVSFVPAIAIFGSVKDAFWQLLVPVLGANMVFMRVLRGDAVGLEHFAVPLAVSTVVTVVCLTVISRLLRKEEIVFGRT